MLSPKPAIFKQYLLMALVVVLIRLAFTLVFGTHSIDSALNALLEGSKVAAWVLAFGLLNSLFDLKKLLRKTPPALRNFSTALWIALSLVPELTVNLNRVKRAAKLRSNRRALGRLRAILIPVLANSVDQAMNLADSMEARGFGRKAKPLDEAIELVGVSFTHNSGEEVLKNLSLEIPKSEFVVITGRTGSGKSTLLKVLQAKYPGVAMVGQFARQSFVADTVFDELAFALRQQGLGSEEISSRVLQLANKFDLAADANPLELSAGWQQRVAIAAALATGTKVLLMDEPFSSLDKTSSDLLFKTLKEIKDDGCTVVVVEHRIHLVRALADRILLLEDGVLTETSGRQIALRSKADFGNVTVLVGENGSGKTTYLNQLARNGGSLVPQPASDLLFLESVSKELQQADLDSDKPAGTATQILETFKISLAPNQNPRELSEGQKLILAIVIQLTRGASPIMLDEPTLGLDFEARAALLEIIGKLAASGTEVIIATHDQEFATALSTKTVSISELVNNAA